MIRWLKNFFGICPHKWKVIKEMAAYDTYTDTRPSYYKYLQQCEKCGKLRNFRT